MYDIIIHSVIISLRAQQGVNKQSCFLSDSMSVRGTKNIETAEIRGYSLRKRFYNNVGAIL